MMLARFLPVILAGYLLSPIAARAEFALKSEDRVVFFGDTLVQSQPQRFSHYVEAFVRAKYPQLRTRFINCGVRNQTVTDGLHRLEDDLKPLSPTIVVVVFGLYDPDRQNFKEEQLNEFRKNYTEIIKGIENLGTKMVLVTPPRPASDRTLSKSKMKFNEIVSQYSQVIREIGATHSLPTIDWFESSTRLHELQQPKKPLSGRRRRTRDILPTPLAHAVVAAQLLKLWQAEPIRVDIEIDWDSGQVTTTPGEIEIRKRTEKELSVSLKNLPLPWALRRIKPAELQEIEWPGAELCQFILKMKNIPGPGVSVVWSKKRVPLDRDQLSNGINIMAWQPIQSRNAPLNKLLNYIYNKHTWRFKYWRKALPARPEEPELQEAFESYCKSLQLFEEGTAQIIFRLPKTFDAVLEFQVNEQADVPTTQSTAPAERKPQ